MSDYLIHHGIKGQKWGVRRFQNKDGTRTNAGKNRESENRAVLRGVRKAFDKSWSAYKETVKPGTLESTLVDSPAREKAIRILQDDKNFQKALAPFVERAKAVQQKYKGKMPKDIDWNEYSRELYDIDRAVGELSVKAGIVKSNGPGDPEEFGRWAYIGFVAARELDEVTGDPGIGDALIHGETKIMYPDQHNYLIHWLKKGEKAKYVDKIKLANGRWRYFYSQAELEAYKLKQHLAKKANELKTKAYDALGGKEKDEFMREMNRGNELYLQGKDEAANKAYDKAMAARDRYWKTPIGATLHAATTVKESVDDFLYDTGLSEKAPQYIAKAKKLLRGIGEGAKDVGARAIVGVAKANDTVGRKLGREYQIAAWQTQKKANNAQQESRRLRALSDSSSAKAASARRHGASDEYVSIHRTDAKSFRKASEREASEASNYRTLASKAQRNYDNSILGKAEARVRAANLRKAQAKNAKAAKKPATRTSEGQKVGSIFRDARGDLDRLKREQEARKKSRSSSVFKDGQADLERQKRERESRTKQKNSSVFKNGREELERQRAMRSKSDRPQSRKKHVTSGGTGVHKRRRIDYSHFER